MADAGGGDFELFNAPAAQEHDEKSDEQFREQMQRAQQQMAQLQKEEGQARGYDFSLAAIIVQFLSQPGNTDLFLLISRAVAQDVPSELLLAIIALVDEKAMTEVFGLLRGGKEFTSLDPMSSRDPADFSAVPDDHKQYIDQWIQNIYYVALKRPQRVLESIVTNYRASAYNPDAVREVSPVLVQFSSFILRNYMSRMNIGFTMESLRDFMQAIFTDIVAKLENLLQGQKRLGSSEKE